MNLKFVVSPLFIFLITSCGKKEDSRTNKDKLSSTQSLIHNEFKIIKKRKVTLNEDHSNKQDFKANINSFEITIKSLKGQISGASVKCTNDLIDANKSNLETKFNEENGTEAHLNVNLSHEDDINTTIHCFVKDQNITIDKFQFDLQKSIVVTQKEYAQKLNLGKAPLDILYIENGAKLITNGADINLEMNELISFGGEISTFDEEEKYVPANDAPGLSGGRISLKTKTSQGKIKINLIGLDAGKQTKIPPPIFDTPKGLQSNNGECKGSRDVSSDYKKDKKCFGRKGQKGFEGKKGYPGYNGGSSGSLYFSHEKMSNLIFHIIYKPGKGSEGGTGGAGGPGGPGGNGSIIMLTEYYEPQRCPMCLEKNNRNLKVYQYPNGNSGDPGDQGKIGDHGNFGNRDESTIEFQDKFIKMKIDTDYKNL